MALLFLRNYWKEIILIVIVLGGIWYVKNLQSTVEEQKDRIQVQNAQIQVLKDNQKTLTAAIDATTKSFEAIEKIDELNKKQFTKLQSIVSTSNNNIAKRLTDIMTEKKPQTCEETIQYLIQGSKEYAK